MSFIFNFWVSVVEKWVLNKSGYWRVAVNENTSPPSGTKVLKALAQFSHILLIGGGGNEGDNLFQI